MASIQKRPNGKWRARYRDDDGKEHAAHRATKREAQSWLVDEQSKLRSGTWVDPKDSKVTLATFYAEWSKRQVWAAGTVVAMDLAVARCTFRDVEFGKLRRSHVEAWVKAMSSGTKPLAASTIKTRVNNVRSALRAAVRDRLLAADPSDGVTLPRRRRAEHAMVIPSPEDVAAVIDAAEPWFRTYIQLCAFAGLRLGEASGLQLADVEFLKRRMHVRRQVQRAERQNVTVSPPKYGSERVVHIPDELAAALSWHVENIGVRGEEQWIFVGDAGLPPHGNTIYNKWVKTLEAAGVKPFTLHTLRHFYASALIAAGCDVVTVQRALGHHSATVTLSTYSHLWPDAEDRTRAATGNLMRTVAALSADSSRTEQAESR